jgi:DNA-binding beta-propeller fold protein YncE
VIDAKSMKVVDSFPAGIDPEGMTIDRKGIFYAVNENDSAVTIIDTSSKAILKTLKVGLEPETAVLSPDQRWVAVSNESSNEIHFLSTADLSIAGKIAVPPNPRGMHFSPDSRLLHVASELGHAIRFSMSKAEQF